MTESNNSEVVFNALDSLNIKYDIFKHPPIPTIEEALVYWKDIKAAHCKNLFLRNHKGSSHYMVIFEHTQKLAIRELEQKLKQGKLSFASEMRMLKYLNLKGGSISPFGLINDVDNHTYLFIDENILNSKFISFHPNDNRMTLVLSLNNFIKYLDWVGNTYEFLKLY